MYHLFISYSSKDRPWADRLNRDLLRSFPALKIFWDRESLRLGEDYRKQLREGTIQTQHLIALWSKDAKDSNYVIYETAAYEAQSRQRIFYMPLDATLAPADDLQAFAAVLESGAYGSGPDAIDADPNLLRNWNRNVRQLGDALLKSETTQPILLAVLAMPAPWLNDLPRAGRLEPQYYVTHYLEAIGLEWPAVEKRYGASAFDWQPFGDGVNIVDLLEDLRMNTNATLGPNQFHWRPTDLLAESMRDEAAYAAIMGELNTQPSVVVVDPISLYHNDVKTIFLKLNEYVGRDNATIVSFSPVHRPGVKILYDALRRRGAPLLDPWFAPPIPPVAAFARCGINLDSLTEFERLVRGRLGMLAAERRRAEAAKITGLGLPA